jgi:hypothetical protein
VPIAPTGKKLAADMLRAPLSLAKMSYDAASGTVIHRTKMHPDGGGALSSLPGLKQSGHC